MSDRQSGGMEWAGRYEALRAHATGEAPLDFVPLRLALLLHRGIAAWMAAETSLAGGTLPERAGRDRETPSANEFSPSRSQLVRLLVGAALLATQGRAR